MAKGPKQSGNRKIQPRLSPLTHDYLQDLADTGLYGSTPTAVALRLIEDGIKGAIGQRVIDRRAAKRRR